MKLLLDFLTQRVPDPVPFLERNITIDVLFRQPDVIVCKRGLRDRNAVRLSVCLSDTRANCDKTNESSADILIPYERKIHVLFWTQRMVGGGRPLLPEILGH